TYLLVLKYTFVPGSDTNDEVSLFVFTSVPPNNEPSPTLGPKTYPSLDANNIGRIALRQGAAIFAPTLTIDGIKVSKAWISGGAAVLSTLNLNLQIESLFGISDTARIYLASASSPYNYIDSSKSVFNVNGSGTFNFQNTANDVNYYIVVKHRNSVETWSSAGKMFSANQLNYDFTTSASTALGGNLTFKNSKWCIYTGDVNQDGSVDLTDLGMIDNDAGNFTSGYVVTDLTGDGFVDASDLAIVDNNAFNYVSVVKP
ncbi:MAG: dockerin type I domain-containing protein, partial [bacterium]